MSTENFLITLALVFLVQGMVSLIGYRLALKSVQQKLSDLFLDETERKSLKLLPIIGNAIFALMFAFLIFQFADVKGEVGLLDGLLYGIVVGMLINLPHGLIIISMFARVREAFMRVAIIGILGSALAGMAVAFVL